MKPFMLGAALAGAAAAGAFAQDFVQPLAPRVDPAAPAPVEKKPGVEGIVAQIFTVRKPWQLVNPLAPKSYGNGQKTVAYSDHDPRKPKGFILFAVEW